VKQGLRRPVHTLLAPLDRAGRRKLYLATALQFVERLAVAAAALTLTMRGREEGALVAGAAVGAVVLHRLACAVLRAHAMGALLESVTAALLADLEGATDAVSTEAEVSLIEGVHAAERVVGQRVPEILGDAPACLFLAGVVLLREPLTVVLQAGAVVAAGAVAVLLVRNVTAGYADRVWQALLPAFDDLLTAVHGRLEIVGNGGEARLLAGLDRKLAHWRAMSRGAGVVALVMGRVPALATAAVGGLLLLWNGGWSQASIASAALLASVVPPFAGLARGALDLSRDLVRASPVVRCLGAAAPVASGAERLERVGDVTWSHVSFCYPGQVTPSVLDVSVTWSPRDVLCFAGKNGSGKSTLVRLLLGLHAPSTGVITLGGAALSLAAGHSLRRRAAYLVQRPFLPDRFTVAEAIRLLAPDAPSSTIKSTLVRLGLWAVLLRHSAAAPLDVRLGALSAGEKQRVAIARIMLRDAPLLILDEPDANLDADGIASLAVMLRDEVKARMVLVIAHSPALLASADRVVRFDGGRVVS
jgi:ABC-type multidrug transport system fused ATPase/permease subunit